MLRTMDNEKILNCEIEYTKCFAQVIESQNFMRFKDDLLKDMYDHNFTLIKNSNSEDELCSLIEDEIILRKDFNYCNIVSLIPISNKIAQKFENKPEISIKGFYLFDAPKPLDLNKKEGCTISKVSSEKMMTDRLHLDLEQDEDMSVDFCTRRLNRRKEIYLSTEGIDSYVCYDNGEVLGSCDLFVNNGVAKIEDFAVSPTKQRQGYGKMILNYIIEAALKSGASIIYLVTDEEDTAKEMYLKCGFKKIGEQTDLFFKIFAT